MCVQQALLVGNKAQHCTAQQTNAQDSTANQCTGQHSKPKHRTAQQTKAQDSKPKHGTAQQTNAQACSANQSTGQHSKPKRSTAQQSKAQDSKPKHSTPKHSTVHQQRRLQVNRAYQYRAHQPDTACLHSAAEAVVARAYLVSHPAVHTIDGKMDKQQLLLLDDCLLGGFLG